MVLVIAQLPIVHKTKINEGSDKSCYMHIDILKESYTCVHLEYRRYTQTNKQTSTYLSSKIPTDAKNALNFKQAQSYPSTEVTSYRKWQILQLSEQEILTGPQVSHSWTRCVRACT